MNALLRAVVIVGTWGIVAGGPVAPQVHWTDLPDSIQRRLVAARIDAGSFDRFREEQARRTAQRVQEGDFDALVYYALQSRSFTDEPPIEPALSAKEFFETGRLPAAVRSRLGAFARTLEGRSSANARIGYFRDVIRDAAVGTSAEAFLIDQYRRAARFLYRKEFHAASQEDIAGLYRDRGFSTDTAVEAGYLVHLGLEAVRAADPARRIARVLIVGPGLDLAPRTGLLEAGPPASYQPYAVADSLLSLGLAAGGELRIVGADVNSRVVDYLRGSAVDRVVLTFVTGVGESSRVVFEEEYRSYFGKLGSSIGTPVPVPALPRSSRGHLARSIAISTGISRAIDVARLDIVTQRLDEAPFDLIVATNVLVYFDDVSLTLALANVAAMLAPGGVLLHNEPRPLVADVTAELGLPVQFGRSAPIAKAADPLYDRVFVHVKK